MMPPVHNWLYTLLDAARAAEPCEECLRMRHVLHGVLSAQLKRHIDDWESSGMVREEVLSILRETYNDLAPKSEQWGVGPAPAATGPLLPGQSPGATWSAADVAAIVRAEMERAKQTPPAEHKPGEPPANPTLPPPPPGQGPGYPLENLPPLSELRRQIDEHQRRGSV